MQNNDANKKDLKYYSDDKMYNVKGKKKINEKIMSYLLLLIGLLIGLVSVYFLNRGVNLSKKTPTVNYHEMGQANYKVYLKENNYYDSKYLDSGMQYVANLINTVNTKFKYEIESEDTIDYKYDYRVVGNLQIVDSNDENKVIFDKQYTLLEKTSKTEKSDHLNIDETVDIDYDKYNSYVNAYKKDYGLSANSRLVVTMEVNVLGDHNGTTEKLQSANKLQITIPLSEQTIGININTDNIDNKSALNASNSSYIKSVPLFISGLGMFVLGVLILYVAVRYHKEYVHENIYTITVKKILKEYDRLIVNGNISIDEHNFQNKILVNDFSELVDASQNLGAPILYYNVIPGEKSFFVIINNDTLYKFRLIKAVMQNDDKNKKNKENKEKND